MKFVKRQILLCSAIVLFFCLQAGSINAAEAESDYICAAYLTGIGCHNCAVTDPVLFIESTSKYPNFIIFEFEIFNDSMANRAIKESYFHSYLPGQRSGVPFFILNQTDKYIGRLNVLKVPGIIESKKANLCPLSSGVGVSFEKIDITTIHARFKIWTKNRVLISGSRGNNKVLKKVLTEENLSQALAGVDFQKVDPVPVHLSGADLSFQHAIMIDEWRLQWNGDPVKVIKRSNSIENVLFWLMLTLVFLGGTLTFFRVHKTKKGKMEVEWKGKIADFVIAVLCFVFLIAFFILAKNVSPVALEQSGYNLPLPIFTFLIALIDGFNPCNMFVLTCLLALMIATTSTRLRVFVVAFSFIATVYVFYFTFMAAWLNVFKYVSFVDPLRIALGIMALITGLINCKELFFFKKGISLTISDKQKGPLMKRMEGMKEIIKSGSMPLLIVSSLGLATLASLIELPCTAGFPILYTGILTGKGMDNTLSYYLYLAYYNFIYVVPLVVIIMIFIYTFRARQITQRHMEIIKFVGGIIMVLLGIVLLVNPGLVGLHVQ